MAKLSVIIPVYNVQKYLPQCLDSILNQTFKDIEVICIDDGSTDDSLAILNDYALRDSRLKILTQSNSGPANARNLGIKVATSDVITFLDSDDWIASENAFEEIYNKFIENDVDLLVFDHYEYNNKKNALKHNNQRRFVFKYNKKDYERKLSFEDFRKYIFRFSPFPWNKFYKRQFLIENEIFFPMDLVAGEDSAFAMYAIMYSQSIYITDKKYIVYRTDLETSLTNAKIHTHLDYPIKVCEAMYDFLNNRGLYEEYRTEHLLSVTRRLLGHYLNQTIVGEERNSYIEIVKNHYKQIKVTKRDIKNIGKYPYEMSLLHKHLNYSVYIIYRLLGFLPVLKIKKSKKSRRYYIFGIPLFLSIDKGEYSKDIFFLGKPIRLMKIRGS